MVKCVSTCYSQCFDFAQTEEKLIDEIQFLELETAANNQPALLHVQHCFLECCLCKTNIQSELV